MSLPTMRRIVIAGPSMSPTLDVGDVALAQPVHRVRSGDVIAFETSGTPIVHRAILVIPALSSALIVHKGDAHGAGYGTTRTTAVFGRVVAYERAGRRAALPARRPALVEVAGAVVALARALRRRVRGA